MNLEKIKPAVPILAVLIVAFAFRFIGINWDNGHALHPDERAIVLVTLPLSLENPNPHFFNYGNFPLYLLKASASVIGIVAPELQGYPNILLVGRFLSVFFDLGTVLLIYLIGKKLWRRQIGLAAAFLYAVTVFPIQNAHYYIVDPQLTFWLTATLFATITFYRKPIWWKFLIFGVLVGMAGATKFTGVLGLMIPELLIIFLTLKNFRQKKSLLIIVRDFIAPNLLVGISFFTAFLTTQPFVFFDFASYWQQVSLQLQMNSNPQIFPYTIQFINTASYIFPLKEIFFWGLGSPLASVCFVGLAWMIYKIWRQRDPRLIIVFLFFLVYFAILGRSAVKYTRYYLPLYPILTLAGGGLIISIVKHLHDIRHRWLTGLFLVTLSIILSGWAVLYLPVYLTTNTRIMASDWINGNLPAKSTLLTEHWDDVVPFTNERNFNFEQLEVYQPDTSQKWQIIDHQLTTGDYLVISSNRVYKSIMKNPRLYPITSEFYANLFNGETNYQLIKTFASYPRLEIGGFKIEINDDNSPESMTIFDHPTVYVFENKMLE